MNKEEYYGILDDFSKVYGVHIKLREDPKIATSELIIGDLGNLWVSRYELKTYTHTELASILEEVKRKYNLKAKDNLKDYMLNDVLHTYVAYEKYFKSDTPKPVPYIPEIKNVIFNEPATIIIWKDGTKTVVKCQEGEGYDPEKGMAMAISKKALGNMGNYCEVFKKWLPEEEE